MSLTLARELNLVATKARSKKIEEMLEDYSNINLITEIREAAASGEYILKTDILLTEKDIIYLEQQDFKVLKAFGDLPATIKWGI